MDQESDRANQPGAMGDVSLLRLAQFRLEAAGEVDWWFRPPPGQEEGPAERPRPGAADAAASRGIQQLLSEWLGNKEKNKEDAA